jgi:hypothetical protein
MGLEVKKPSSDRLLLSTIEMGTLLPLGGQTR